jgi:hypothetical protein
MERSPRLNGKFKKQGTEQYVYVTICVKKKHANIYIFAYKCRAYFLEGSTETGNNNYLLKGEVGG